jgi:hypothetical protein
MDGNPLCILWAQLLTPGASFLVEHLMKPLLFVGRIVNMASTLMMGRCRGGGRACVGRGVQGLGCSSYAADAGAGVPCCR